MQENNNNDQLTELAAEAGRRLRLARESMHLSTREVAQQQKLTAWYIERIEAGELSELAAPVYLCGYIRRYAELVGVDCSMLLGALARSSETMPAPAEGVTRSVAPNRNYAKIATAIAGTAMVVAPLLWWSNQANRDLSLGAPSAEAPTQPPVSVESNEDAQPTVASMNPVPTPVLKPPEPPPVVPETDVVEPAVTAATEPPATEVEAARELTLRLDNDAWVEIYDGTERLEFGLLRAGAQLTYQFQDVLNVKIGAALGARVEIDGVAYALDPHIRGDVANFQVPAQHEVESPQG